MLVAASLRREHITGLASADQAFASVTELAHVDPADPDMLRRLGI